jgi:hypothetical protein
VGRIYAGILGPTAFATALLRGLLHQGGIESTVLSAWLALLAFAATGFVAGQIAGWVVADSVRSQVLDEMARQDAKPNAVGESRAA